MSLYSFKIIDLSDEMKISFKIRKKVFCIEQKISEEIEFDDLDYLCEHFLIYKKGEAIGTARVRKKEDHLFSGDLNGSFNSLCHYLFKIFIRHQSAF